MRCLLLCLGLSACVAPSQDALSLREPLASWAPGGAREQILDFVARVTDPQSPDHVPPAERIAVFDNDGTLWCEKPLYTQVAFMVDRARRMSAARPELASQEPFATLLNAPETLLDDHEALLTLLTRTHTGMTQAEFTRDVDAWFESARHPRFERAYDELLYEPMLELLALLDAHGFETWICTGGGLDFVRCIAQEAYDIPAERVIGSAILKSYRRAADGSEFARQPELVKPINDGPGKPVNLQRRLDRPPLIAVGNSDGDFEMLEYVDDRSGPSLSVLLHHDDAEREYDYDKGTERALREAPERGWVVVSIARDFERVFAP